MKSIQYWHQLWPRSLHGTHQNLTHFLSRFSDGHRKKRLEPSSCPLPRGLGQHIRQSAQTPATSLKLKCWAGSPSWKYRVPWPVVMSPTPRRTTHAHRWLLPFHFISRCYSPPAFLQDPRTAEHQSEDCRIAHFK